MNTGLGDSSRREGKLKGSNLQKCSGTAAGPALRRKRRRKGTKGHIRWVSLTGHRRQSKTGLT